MTYVQIISLPIKLEEVQFLLEIYFKLKIKVLKYSVCGGRG